MSSEGIFTITSNIAKLIKSQQLDVDSVIRNYVNEINKKIKYTNQFLNKNISKQISELKNVYLEDKLVIVLGAGASIDYGLPSWNTLLQTLLAKTFENNNDDASKSLLFAEVFNTVFGGNSLVVARYLSNEFKDTEFGFEEEIKKLLYQQINSEYTSLLMREVVQLCAAPGKSPNLNSIITYNYDDILEEELKKASIKIPFKSIYKIGQNPKSNELPIHHVHGFIPRKGKISLDNKITLGEDLYHQQYTNIYNWQNLVQLNKFKDYSCVFVGSSLADPNQRRLLDIANTQRGDTSKTAHFIFKKRYSRESIEKSLKKFLDSNLEILSNKENQNIKLDELADIMIDAVHRFETNDAASLGVQTIWVDDHGDVPMFLQKMREIG